MFADEEDVRTRAEPTPLPPSPTTQKHPYRDGEGTCVHTADPGGTIDLMRRSDIYCTPVNVNDGDAASETVASGTCPLDLGHVLSDWHPLKTGCPRQQVVADSKRVRYHAHQL